MVVVGDVVVEVLIVSLVSSIKFSNFIVEPQWPQVFGVDRVGLVYMLLYMNQEYGYTAPSGISHHCHTYCIIPRMKDFGTPPEITVHGRTIAMYVKTFKFHRSPQSHNVVDATIHILHHTINFAMIPKDLE